MSPDALAVTERHAESDAADASPRLPEGWAWASLGEILPLEYGKSLPERLRDSTGKVAVYGSSGRVGWHTAAMVVGPTLIVGRKGSAGAVFYCNEDCWPIDTVYYTKPKRVIDLRYGFHFLKWKALGRLDQSTAIPSLSRDIYSDVAIPVAPLPEQRRIVARIDELFAEIAEGEAALERARQGLDTWRRALLEAAVTGELTRDWREANRPTETGAHLLARIRAEREASNGRPPRGRRANAAEPLDTAALPELPEGWLWATLAELARSSSYGTSVKCSYEAIGAAVVRIPNIRSGRVDLSDLKKATENLGKNSNDALRPGDLLIVRTNGSEDLIGRGAIVTEPLGIEAYFASYLIRFRLVGDHHLWRWIAHVFNSPIVRKWMISHIASSAGQYNVSQTALASLPLPIPPASEIRVLGDCLREQLESADDADVLLEAESTNGLALRQSILKAAFEGRLVSQDPADEPASVLLGRLRTDYPSNGARRRRARAAADFSYPSLPGLTHQPVDPRVEPAGDE